MSYNGNRCAGPPWRISPPNFLPYRRRAAPGGLVYSARRREISCGRDLHHPSGTEQLAGIPTPDVSLSAGRRNRAPPLTTISKANGIQNATAVKGCRFDPARSRVPAPNCVEGSSRRGRLSFASLSLQRRRTPCLSRQSYDPIEHHHRN